jgi:hypothetical protein
MIYKLKFSHEYPKLWGQETAILLRCEEVQLEDLDPDLIEYDTCFDDGPRWGYYPLPKKGHYLLLTFQGEKKIPFTTLRRWTPRKAAFYEGAIGELFKIHPSHGVR